MGRVVMPSILKNFWSDDLGQISEYALILATILLVAMAGLVHEQKALQKTYGWVAVKMGDTGSTKSKNEFLSRWVFAST